MDAEASKTGEIMMGGSLTALINWGFFCCSTVLNTLIVNGLGEVQPDTQTIMNQNLIGNVL